MPADTSLITPYLVVRDAASAIDFYVAAFGAAEIFRMTDPASGKVGHAELSVGTSTFMLADEYPDFGALGPDTIGGTPVTFHMTSQAVDDDAARAERHGATVLRPAADQSYGERVALIVDPFGHRWMLAQKIEDVTPAEMQRRWDEETGA